MTARARILERTNGGFDVFVHYMGEDCKKKLFRNPFRESDKNPSCHLYFHRKSDRFFLKDFGDSNWCGDCFWLVAKLTGLNEKTDFIEILRTIDKELNLFIMDNESSISHTVMKKVNVTVQVNDPRPLTFIPRYRNFNKFELAYWQSYGITRSLLERYQVRCLSSCYFERADGTHFNLYGTKEVPMFGYTFNSGTGIKVYRPGAQIGRFMYAGNLPSPYIFGMEQLAGYPDRLYNPFLNEEEFINAVLFITGGEKDVMSLAARGFNAISLNSETARIPEDLFTQLLGRFSPIVFLYDSDETGKRESGLRVTECRSYGCYSLHLSELHPSWNPVVSVSLPLAGTKKEKDVSDFFRLGHTASELIQLVYDDIELISNPLL